MRQPTLSLKYSKEIKDPKGCFCNTGTGQIGKEEISCVSCFKPFHKECLKVTGDNFECPFCSLEKMDPLHEVVECLSFYYSKDSSSKAFEVKATLSKSPEEALEIRCVRIDGKNHGVQTWPDYG